MLPARNNSTEVNVLWVTLAGGPDDLCFLHGCRGGWETMDPSPPTDRQYIDFNSVFLYKTGTYATGTKHQKIPM